MTYQGRAAALLLGAGAAALMGVQAQAASARQFHADHVLGTSFDMSVTAASEAEAWLAMSAARMEIDRLDKILSMWRTDSEIAALNNAPNMTVSSDLYEVIAASEYWRARTGGAFDARLGAVEAAWRNSDDAAPADLIALANAAQAAPRLDGATRAIMRPDGVTFAPDGVAKGYVIDRALEAARRIAPQAESMTINLGGDIRVSGAPQRIGVADPANLSDNAAPLMTLLLKDCAIATSGRGARDITIGGKAYAHTFTPASGAPVGHVMSASVVAPRAADADALATAFNVMAPDEAIALADSMPGVEALIATADGALHHSSGWSNLLAADDGEARFVQTQAAAAGPAWPANFQLDIQYQIPTISAPDYKKPYVIMWITDANRQVVKTLLMLGERPQWQDDNYIWWRRVGRFNENLVSQISRPTRAPGRYNIVWDGTNDAGQRVGQGQYTLHIEATREHGGHSYVSAPLTLGGAPVSASTPADAEIGAATAQYGARP